MTRVSHVLRLVAIQALVASALCGLVSGQENQLAGTDQRAGSHSQQSVGSSATQVSCTCLDPVIHNAGACKKNYAVFFTAQWCQACHEMYPIIEKLRAEGYIVFVLDYDKYPDAAKKAGVKILPLTLIYEDGQIIERVTGTMEQKVLERKLKTRNQQNIEAQDSKDPEPPTDTTSEVDYVLI